MTFLFNLVPGWLWAVMLAVALAGAFGEAEMKSHYKASAIEQKAKVGALESAIATQKNEAAAVLRTETASTLAQQTRLDTQHALQEKNDAANNQTVDGLRATLRALRVQHAAQDAGRGSGSGSAPSQAAADSGSGLGHRAEAHWLVPGATDQAPADDDAYDADKINEAYISCRADAANVRTPKE